MKHSKVNNSVVVSIVYLTVSRSSIAIQSRIRNIYRVQFAEKPPCSSWNLSGRIMKMSRIVVIMPFVWIFFELQHALQMFLNSMNGIL